jgi:hypothetical protein
VLLGGRIELAGDPRDVLTGTSLSDITGATPRTPRSGSSTAG